MPTDRPPALPSRPQTGKGASHTSLGVVDDLAVVTAVGGAVDPAAVAAISTLSAFEVPADEPVAKKLPRQIGRGFKLEDRILFCRQLATFVRSGIPLLHAMDIIIRQTKSPVLREAYTTISASLQRGEPLSRTMSSRPKVFPRLMVDLVEASERTGRLDVVLSDLAIHYERDLAIRRRIRQALTYPLLVLGLAFFVVVVLIVFVMPAFVRLFSEFEAQLPATARLLLSTSSFLSSNWQFVLLGMAAGGAALVLFARGERGRRVFHRFVLRIPVASRIVHLSITARWARTLGSMLRAGVPMITSLHVAREVTANRVYQARLAEVSEKVAMGRGLSGPLAATLLFPDMVVQMVNVGEESGRLEEHLDHVASFYETELNYRVEQAMSYLEPIVLVIVGAAVGFVAISLVSTMYHLADVV